MLLAYSWTADETRSHWSFRGLTNPVFLKKTASKPGGMYCHRGDPISRGKKTPFWYLKKSHVPIVDGCSPCELHLGDNLHSTGSSSVSHSNSYGGVVKGGLPKSPWPGWPVLGTTWEISLWLGHSGAKALSWCWTWRTAWGWHLQSVGTWGCCGNAQVTTVPQVLQVRIATDFSSSTLVGEHKTQL